MPPKSKRTVISWFGWDIRDFGLIDARDLAPWVRGVERLIASMGMRIERLGNIIDLIIGKAGASVSRREFFRFQRKWDELNARHGIRMSGLLWLMTEDGGYDPTAPSECYRFGVRISGDSIGRPNRHSLAATRHRRETAREAGGEMPGDVDSGGTTSENTPRPPSPETGDC